MAIKGVGKRLRTEHLQAHTAPSSLPYCRVAVVVGKHGHTVVKRNQLRRRLRELIRRSIIPGCSSFDMVLRTLPSAYGAGFKELSGEVNEIKTRLMKYTLE